VIHPSDQRLHDEVLCALPAGTCHLQELVSRFRHLKALSTAASASLEEYGEGGNLFKPFFHDLAQLHSGKHLYAGRPCRSVETPFVGSDFEGVYRWKWRQLIIILKPATPRCAKVEVFAVDREENASFATVCAGTQYGEEILLIAGNAHRSKLLHISAPPDSVDTLITNDNDGIASGSSQCPNHLQRQRAIPACENDYVAHFS